MGVPPASLTVLTGRVSINVCEVISITLLLPTGFHYTLTISASQNLLEVNRVGISPNIEVKIQVQSSNGLPKVRRC